MRLIIVPSENPASTKRITPSLVNVGVFSSFRVAFSPPSTGGLMMRTVAEPVTFPSFSFPPSPPRDRLDDRELDPDPKILVLPCPASASFGFFNCLKNGSPADH